VLRSKNLKYGHERYNLDNRNLATMLWHEKKHKGKIIKMEQCNIPRFYQILGNFFAFVLLEMIEISQGFKNFLSLFESFIRKCF
jgi:hypothetical protein